MIAGEQALQCAEGGQAVYIAGGDMEQGAQGNGSRVRPKGRSTKASRPQDPPAPAGQPVLQGLPAGAGAGPPAAPPSALGGGVPERCSGSSSPGIQPVRPRLSTASSTTVHGSRGGPDRVSFSRSSSASSTGGQLAVLGEQCSGGKDHKTPPPLPSSSAAPAAQVWMSGMPTRPRMVR